MQKGWYQMEDNGHTNRYLEVASAAHNAADQDPDGDHNEHRGLPGTLPGTGRSGADVTVAKIMGLAAGCDERNLVTQMEEICREALFASELQRLTRLGVDLTHAYYVPHFNYIAQNDMVYAECHVHKHKLLVGSILGASDPEKHAVDKRNVGKVCRHYPELHRFVAMVNGDYDKQCAELCLDFLTDPLLITLLMENGFWRDAMILWTFGEIARAYDQWGIEEADRKLAVDRARRLICIWFGPDLGRVGPRGIAKGTPAIGASCSCRCRHCCRRHRRRHRRRCHLLSLRSHVLHSECLWIVEYF